MNQGPAAPAGIDVSGSESAAAQPAGWAGEHVDVLIVGAGLSGIGAAVRLKSECPDREIAIIESRQTIGGTWDLFRYPGIRSDSDMYTLGYPFKPWQDRKSIADGDTILQYIKDTAAEYGIDRDIRFGQRVTRAEFRSQTGTWKVTIEETGSGAEAPRLSSISCDFLLICGGYYRYDEGYEPQFPGREKFAGSILHAQHWPEDLDYAGKEVLVIGSGATAVTLVPALAERGAHVTMLQRSPTYVLSLPGEDPIAKRLRRLLPLGMTYRLVRAKNVLLTMASYQLSRRRPRLVRRLIRSGLERQLPAGYDIDRHFKPRYDPWDQRLCIVPDGDLFKAISNGSAQIVTDQIDCFSEHGVRLQSGESLEADIVVLATGLNLQAFGGVELLVDGAPVKLSEKLAFRGMMLTGVPNFAFVIGYTNASWTLKSDLTSRLVCRILNRMRKQGSAICVPVNEDASVAAEPILDLTSGYVQRAIDQFPRQGSKKPWKLRQNYLLDLLDMRGEQLDGSGALRFLPLTPASTGAAAASSATEDADLSYGAGNGRPLDRGAESAPVGATTGSA